VRGNKQNTSSKTTSTVPSPASHGTQPATPMANVSAAAFAAAWAYPSPYYGYPAYHAEGQYYPASPYNFSPYYGYGASPSYTSGSSSTTDAASGPSGQPQYPFYGQYPYYWTPTQSVPYFPPAFTPTATEGAEDRSTTPTPAGHAHTTESSLESQ